MRKRPVSVYEQASEVHMVLPSRSGASHGCDCILCAVPALSRWRLRCFSRQLAREDTASRPHCGVTRDRGWSDSQAGARYWTHSTAYDGQQHSSVSSVPLLVTTRPGSPLMAMAVWHWRQHVRMPRMLPSRLVTCQLPKLTPGRYRRRDEANGTRVHEVQVN